MRSSLTFGPQDQGEDTRPGAGSGAKNGRSSDRQFLEQVLERALAAPDPAESMSGKDWEMLLDVARRRQEEPLSLEPVTVELVRALLRSYFRSWKGPDEAWGRISGQIAGTLFEDPVFHERLRVLWLRLIEAAR